ncbi:SDR family NAD(P)-dependent oxidoreductase [Tautonia rosea]|uniref:SDR family NAD(P)-dependent oxidoreductase n=1 Tax=Tautonia rosea TaxID=2728037 RepID=UPI001473AC6D|nr:SDR family NAD(P)-dependent oxidoreductase [Tautonia rosea]
MKRIRARSAIVTGASSGIGACLAVQLAQQGIHVGLTARRADRLETLARSIQDAGGVAVVAPADAADRQATTEAIGRLEHELGPVDLLIANAGLGRSSPAVGFSAEVVEEIVRVNLIGASVAIEVLLPGMLNRGRGQIVGMSSLAAFRGLPGSSAYCASKAALSTLLEGLRPELRRRGVLVTIVHPGFVKTPMTEQSRHVQPWMMDADRAASIILNGIARGRRRVDFPAPTLALMRLVRLLPAPIFDRIAARVLST